MKINQNIFRSPEFLYFLFFISVMLFFCEVNLTSCNAKVKEKRYTIGFSQCTGADGWRKTMLEEMRRELSFHDNIDFIYKDADGTSQNQVDQIKELVNQNIDLLIVSPNEVTPLSPIIQKVYNSNIPVVVVDRRTDSKKYTAFIGASNYEVGENAGRYAVSLLKGKGNVIELTGLPDASPVIDRHDGFLTAISNYPGINYIKKLDANSKPFLEKEEEVLKSGNIDLIYAQNDFFAFDAFKICKKLGLEKTIKIIGIDGLPIKGGGLDMVANKYISATVLYPTGGQEAIQTSVNILEGKPYQKENQLPTTIIDSSNVRIMKLQTEKVLAQQKDIDRRQKKIEKQRIIETNQTNLIYIISISLVLAVILGAILFYYLRQNRKINATLALQNEEISTQRNQLIELGKKAQEANEAKIKFFTNISHELRTPLTLILSPIEELLQNEKIYRYAGGSLLLIQRNAIRLLRLINQLMDFRKIEIDKLKLRVSENDIVVFLNQIIESYKSIAKKRNIDLRLITKLNFLNVWFDETMLDKVLFNLLSNAFKFTNDDGHIHVFIDKDEAGKNVVITVEDNGAGMTKTTIEHAFELFYQGEYENYKGSGLGLALSKELINLHHGTIDIESEKWKGTKFTITLPLGDSHWDKQEIMSKEIAKMVMYEDEKIYTTELLTQEQPEESLSSGGSKENSILIIEDYPDLKNFLKNSLAKNYEILEADNGNSALQHAFETIPDLIISDVMLPGKDGFELTNILKSDIRTSHIPIILLTARTSVESQISGMKYNADSYITKPYNQKYLEENIRSLLANRSLLKEHYTGQIPSELKTQTLSKLDRKFINEFNSQVESNIANENFSIEDICKHIGISKMQLYRKVKALLNSNVNEYILNVRLQKAKYLLRHEELSIGEVAYKVGFSSPAYFSTVFKSKFKATPSEFKEKVNTP
jgi:signal transduction histidine kinase/DNA-binding response OmpR family regulator/ABC-type xylose transport system substrate-binding protein